MKTASPFLLRSLPLGLLLAFSLTSCGKAQESSSPKPDSTSGVFRSSLSIDKTPMQRSGAVLKSYADMLDKVQPSIVTIQTGIEQPATRRRSSDEDVLRFFFGLPAAPQPRSNGNSGNSWQQLGIGSGVIVSRSGYIITNRHVVIPPDLDMELRDYIRIMKLRVSIPGRETPVLAELIDFSSETDIAVLKIPGTDLPAATLADSDQVRVGDVVFALGAPFGIDKTVTMGIISARRNDEVLAGFEKQELLQTDASINPGNSGGPLIDADGRIIGINTAIYSRSGGNMGIGFAIPINKAVAAADALSKPRGYLGVQLAAVDQRVARLYGFKGGAFVGSVEPGTPAEKGGLREGDVILEMDSTAVGSDTELRQRLAAQSPGARVRLSILREEKKGEITITLGDRNRFGPSTDGSDNSIAGAPPDSGDYIVGMKILPVADADRATLNLPEGVPGLLVAAIQPNSPAASAGLRQGDIILRINSRTPATAGEAADAITTLSRNRMAMLHVRQGDVTKLMSLELP
jgi:serine protease Do